MLQRAALTLAAFVALRAQAKLTDIVRLEPAD